MTTKPEVTETKILSIDDLYSELKESLSKTKDGDAELLAILKSDLLHPNVSEKEHVANALKSLMALAAKRAHGELKEGLHDDTSKA